MVVTLTARFEVRPGDEERFLEAAHGAIEATRREPGCIEYRLHRHAGTSSFLFYENWRSQADLDEHAASPHIAEFREVVTPLLEGEPVLESWSEVE